MNERDMTVLSKFRENSRASLTRLSKETKIPVSTIHDKIKDYKKKKVIDRHTTLLNFKKMGYDIRVNMLLTVDKTQREKLKEFLQKKPKVNTLYRINNGYDFMVDLVLKNITELDQFTNELENFNIKERKDLFIMEELKKEEFLSYKENIGVVR